MAGATTFTVDPVVKLLPVSVTGTEAPRKPEAGLIELRIGIPGVTTVKVTGLVAPPGVVRVTFRAVRGAVGEIVFSEANAPVAAGVAR